MLPSIDRSFTRPAGHHCDRSGGANAGHDRPNNLFPLMELRMPRALSTRIAAAALLAVTGLSCSVASNPSSPTTAYLAQAASYRCPTLTP